MAKDEKEHGKGNEEEGGKMALVMLERKVIIGMGGKETVFEKGEEAPEAWRGKPFVAEGVPAKKKKLDV